MQVSVENGEGLERRMTVGLEPEQIDTEVEKRLGELARSARIPGFRPGKVPVKILRRRYGGQMRQDVFGELVKTSFSDALVKEGLRPVGIPRIEPDIDVSANRYAYTAVFEVLPTIALGALDGKTIKRPVAEVTDADLEVMLTRLREQRKSWKTREDPARSGDRLRIRFTGTMDGEPFEEGSSQETEVVLGVGRMIPGFEEGLIGARTGSEIHLDLTFPDGHPNEHLRGKPVAFEVQVLEVAEPMVPELDADFAKGFGIADGNLDTLRLDVRQNMERRLKEEIDARVKHQAMGLLLETNQIELPDSLVEHEIGALKQQIRQNVGGGTFELPDQLFRDRARRRVALGLILEEVVRANGIRVDPDRVRGVVEDLASTYEHPQEVIDHYYADKEHLAPVESLTLENQIVDWVLDQVTVVDEPTTFDELSNPSIPG